MACRSGGHSSAGYSVNDEMVVDLSAMSYVHIDEARQMAAAGSATNFGVFNAELEVCDLHVPGGGCETVGLAGYMQGGGYGFTSLMYGMNCDNVIGVRIALADGRVVHANEIEHEDLFWAVRGGTGNNFGVLLEIDYRLSAWTNLGVRVQVAGEDGEPGPGRHRLRWRFGRRILLVPACSARISVIKRCSATPRPRRQGSAPYFLVRGVFNGSEADLSDALGRCSSCQCPTDAYRDIWREGSYRELNDYLAHLSDGDSGRCPRTPPGRSPSPISSIVYLTAEECDPDCGLYRESPRHRQLCRFGTLWRRHQRRGPDASAYWHRPSMLDVFTVSFWMYERERPDGEGT